jgi:hypothetical protein
MSMRRLMTLAALLLAACATTPPGGSAVLPQPTETDRQRLRDWRAAFTTGLAQARAGGQAEAIAREGTLLLPEAALGGGIPSGTYRCRTVKLGARQPGMLPFNAYPSFTCQVGPMSGGVQSFAKRTGSQRQIGVIRPHDQLRSIFLGTLVIGDELRAMPYGIDTERDAAGWVERIGPNRWRIVLPYPRFESLTDVVELVPAN